MPAAERDGCAPAGDGGRLVRRACLVAAGHGPAHDVASLLLSDLAAALVAYERLAAGPGPDGRPAGGAPRVEPLWAEEGAEALALLRPDEDALVLGVCADLGDLVDPVGAGVDGGRAREFAGALDAARRVLAHVPRDVRAYAVAACQGPDPSPAGLALDGLARSCGEAGLAWMGGLAVAGAELAPGLARQPRMGVLRRPVSEATDRVVAALRAGSAVVGDDGGAPSALLAGPAVPSALWCLGRRLLAGRGGDAS